MQQRSLRATKEKPDALPKVRKPKGDAKLMIWDGNWYIHRAHHGYGQYQRLTNKRGEDVTILYGFLQMIGADLLKYRPTHAVVVFDGDGSSKYRRDIYPEYKLNRHTEETAAPVMYDQSMSITEQISKIMLTINQLGLSVMIHDGIEGDDLLGALVEKFFKRSKILVCTGDKDAAALVRPGVKLYNSQMKKLFDEDGIQERYGVMPNQMVDYLCLIGDSIDNIPGCPQVGQKNATRILAEYGSIDEAFKSGKEKRLTEWYKAKTGYRLAKKLITLRSDIKINTGLDDLEIKRPEKDAREFLEFMGIRKPHEWFQEHLSGTRTLSLFGKKSK